MKAICAALMMVCSPVLAGSPSEAPRLCDDTDVWTDYLREVFGQEYIGSIEVATDSGTSPASVFVDRLNGDWTFMTEGAGILCGFSYGFKWKEAWR